MEVSRATGSPGAFGVLTTLTEEQAVERSRADADNKGREAALAALEMTRIFAGLGVVDERE
jgi:6,7-dimethyl-8-ribityllumazine synthase